MGPEERVRVHELLERGGILDAIAFEFCTMMLEPQEQLAPVLKDNIQITEGQEKGELRVRVHRAGYLLKYSHAPHARDGIWGEFQLAEEKPDGSLGDILLTIDFDISGKTNLQGDALEMVVHGPRRVDAKASFLRYFANAVQKRLRLA